jgi:hypothetical protein
MVRDAATSPVRRAAGSHSRRRIALLLGIGLLGGALIVVLIETAMVRVSEYRFSHGDGRELTFKRHRRPPPGRPDLEPPTRG